MCVGAGRREAPFSKQRNVKSQEGRGKAGQSGVQQLRMGSGPKCTYYISRLWTWTMQGHSPLGATKKYQGKQVMKIIEE